MSEGITPSERYLAKLCRQSFLSLWSYPNVFTDRGRRGGGRSVKEVCDLLVVFGNDVIIFSDKTCAFKSSGNIELDWRRWHRRAVSNSIDQIRRAERWLRQFGEHLYIDRKCTKRLPISLPPTDKTRFHRVVVAHGAKNACQRHYNGGSGSFRINIVRATGSPLIEDLASEPFTITHHGAGDFAHVLDDTTLEVVLKTLDTVSDFCAYLRKKEDLLTRLDYVVAAGEEELLAFYLQRMNEDQEHDFVLPSDAADSNALMLVEGFWAEFASSDQYRRKIEADRASYIVDSLIEHISEQIIDGTLEVGSDLSINELQHGVRLLASFGRVERRGIGKAFLEVMKSTGPDQTRFRGTVMGVNKSIGVALLLHSPARHESYDEYKLFREGLLRAYCHTLKLRNPAIKEIVGIALEPHKSGRGGSETIAYLDVSNWTEEDYADAREVSNRAGLLKNPNLIHTREHEYPDSHSPRVLREHRHTGLNRHERRRREKLARKKKP